MKRIVILSLAASLMSFAVQSQNIDKTKLDAYFDTLTNNDKFMGSVAVSRNNELIYAKTVGFSDMEHGLKANENSKYRIASISKTFTAVLMFIAIDENKLCLDQTIDKFFPAINNAHKITISHLLYHRSGISDDDSFTDHANQPKTAREALERIIKSGSDFEPDTKAAYGNMNFILLSYILEKIYQTPFSEIFEEKIIKPAGLTNTYCVNKISAKENECKSYKFVWQIVHGRSNWEREDEIDLSILLSAVGIISNATDLVLFSDALFNGKLISIRSLQQMKAIKDGFGMGIWQIPFDEQTGFGHPGAIDGFSSLFVHFPDGKISIALTANGLNYNRNNIAHTILSAVYNLPYDIPKFNPHTYNVSNDDLNKYPGTYSSEQIPVKISIININNTLFGAKETSFVPLKATEKDKFVFEEEDIVLEFNQADKTMVFKQGNDKFNFKRISNLDFSASAYDIADEELDKYLGTYSSEQISIKITILKACHKLFVHATGKSSLMLLDATEKNTFEFANEGYIFEFNPSDKTLVLKQDRRVLSFVKEN